MSAEMMMGRADGGRPVRGARASRSRRFAVLGLAFVFTAVLSACEEDNVLGNGGGASGDGNDPLVEIREPVDLASVAIGQTVYVEAHVSDRSGIEQVTFEGYAFRGDPELGTGERITRYEETVVDFPNFDVDTLPTDTIVKRNLAPVGEGSEVVSLIVTATDASGRVSADTVQVHLGGPSIAVVEPANGDTHRQTSGLTIQVSLADETAGLESARLLLTGIFDRNIDLGIVGTPTDTLISYTIPASDFTVTGDLVIRAQATNTNGITSTTSPAVVVEVVDASTPDSDAPQLTVSIDDPDMALRVDAPFNRVEQSDAIPLRIRATDESGIATVGADVLAILNGGADTARISYTQPVAPVTNPVTREILIRVSDLYEAASPGLANRIQWPDRFRLEISAFAEDQFGNLARDNTTLSGSLLAVAGRTVQLPEGGIIADAVVDTTRDLLMLSNFTRSRVEVLPLTGTTFASPISTGAQPWGLFIGNKYDALADNDRLLVANSGGTNISVVPLNTLQEDPTQRIQTPDVALWQVDMTLDEQANQRIEVSDPISFSDRPQFLAEANTGEVLYSTVPTPAAADGTIRVMESQPGWSSPEVRLLFPGGQPADPSDDNAMVIAHADHVEPVRGNLFDELLIVDHPMGFPGGAPLVYQGPADETAIESFFASTDVEVFAGSYVPSSVALQDTTYVAASSDGTWIGFGEGATGGEGRIILWNSLTGQSTDRQILDLIHNASERVTGIALNQDGSLGAARGDLGAYFFGPDLRLRGMSGALEPGGYGVAIHPLHDGTSPANSYESLSFVGTAESEILAISTFHFNERGVMPLKNRIAGPLRAVLPVSPPAGCPGQPECVVVRLFGVTQSEGAPQPDGVVVVDVREKDLQ